MNKRVISFFTRAGNIMENYLQRKMYAQIPEPNIWANSGKAEDRIVIDLDIELGNITKLSAIEIKQGRALAWSDNGEIIYNDLEKIKEELLKGVNKLKSYGYKFNGHWYDSLKFAGLWE